MKLRNLFIPLVLWLSFATPSEAFLIRGTESAIDVPATKYGGTEYIPLTSICKAFGMAYTWDDLTKKISFENGSREFVFLVDESIYEVNGRIETLRTPPRIVAGVLMMPAWTLTMDWWQHPQPVALYPTVRRPVVVPSRGEFTISKVILDPGHGGHDIGARSRSGFLEKDIVLNIALRLRAKLSEVGMDVILTRSGDYFVPLAGRAQMANQSDADLYISIHANASPSAYAYGFEVYYLSEALDDSARAVQIMENSSLDYEENIDFPNKNGMNPTLWDMILTENRKESIELASAIHRSVRSSHQIPTRGIKSARFFVLKWIDKPSILIETGFLSNFFESRRLADPFYQDRLADHLFQGIMAFKRDYERTRGFTA